MRARFIRLAGLALPLLFSACTSDGTTSGKQPQSSGNEIVIGVAGPMTGDLAAFGGQLRRGAQQAAADLNAQGGGLGKQVRLVISGERCNPRRAARVAHGPTNKGAGYGGGHF